MEYRIAITVSEIKKCQLFALHLQSRVLLLFYFTFLQIGFLSTIKYALNAKWRQRRKNIKFITESRLSQSER